MSEILNIAHEMARDLVTVGAMDEITMRRMDELCLPAVPPLSPEDIQKIRTTNHVSQAVFAVLLGMGKTTVQQWEQGVKRPSGAALRLLDLINRKGIKILL
ncbi:putative transcriptional regulator [Gammaproteobacteria bacterium]